MMRPRTYPTDAGGDAGHFFDGPAHAEFLEAAQFDHVDARIGDVADVVQLNRYFRMTFDAANGLNDKCFSHFDYLPARFGCNRPAPAKRLKVAARSGICLGSSPIVESAPIISTIGFAVRLSGPKQPRHGI